MEITQKNQPDLIQSQKRESGQRHDSVPPDTEKEDISPGEAIRRIATSAGSQAGTSEKTAEAVGERVGDAYSDAGRAAHTQKGNVGLRAATRAGSQANRA